MNGSDGKHDAIFTQVLKLDKRNQIKQMRHFDIFVLLYSGFVGSLLHDSLSVVLQFSDGYLHIPEEFLCRSETEVVNEAHFDFGVIFVGQPLVGRVT